MKLKKIFLILAALVAFSSALTAVSDYEYLLGKYKIIKETEEEKLLKTQQEEKVKRESAEIMKNAEYLEVLNTYLVVIPGKDYLMMRTEVTQKQWQIIMGNNPSNFEGDDLPVENVSWIDAVVFCNKLSEKEGLKPCYSYKGNSNVEEWKFLKEELSNWTDKKWKKFNESLVCDSNANGYRLPTVEEWQYAARGGQNYKYSGSDKLYEVGWYSGNSGKKTHLVALKTPNGYGLHDMSGNVWEWCWDSYPNNSGKRYNCGGGWFNDAYYCGVGDMVWSDAYRVGKYLGFRIVRSSSKK